MTPQGEPVSFPFPSRFPRTVRELAINTAGLSLFVGADVAFLMLPPGPTPFLEALAGAVRTAAICTIGFSGWAWWVRRPRRGRDDG
ncbi:MAG TPA: hypothetical protein VGJ86_12625 [Acidimicrobiales bacterium]